jgi:hypothetical protein
MSLRWLRYRWTNEHHATPSIVMNQSWEGEDFFLKRQKGWRVSFFLDQTYYDDTIYHSGVGGHVPQYNSLCAYVAIWITFVALLVTWQGWIETDILLLPWNWGSAACMHRQILVTLRLAFRPQHRFAWAESLLTINPTVKRAVNAKTSFFFNFLVYLNRCLNRFQTWTISNIWEAQLWN